MDIREEISRVYDRPGWRKKVEKMDVGQVQAIYLRFKKQGLLGTTIEERMMPVERFRVTVKDSEPRLVREHVRAEYQCVACGLLFVRDNPDLELCVRCGTPVHSRL